MMVLQPGDMVRMKGIAYDWKFEDYSIADGCAVVTHEKYLLRVPIAALEKVKPENRNLEVENARLKATLGEILEEKWILKRTDLDRLLGKIRAALECK